MAALPQLALRPINTTTVHHHQQPDLGTQEHDDDEGSCRTPTSPEAQLPPEAKVCPPAPRKPRRAALRPRKRRLELELEECSDILPEVITVSAEELEAAAFRRRRPTPADHSSCSSSDNNGRCRKRKR